MLVHSHPVLRVVLVVTGFLLITSTLSALEKETELLEVLRSNKPAPEKALACKNLAIYGSEKAVAELAKLLPDPQLSSWARTALEAIPGPASDDALRQAVQQLEGRLLVGMINSVGVRRDQQAVKPLTERLASNDVEVASAAAVALGHIATPQAIQALRNALKTDRVKVRSAVAEGCVLGAERLASSGKESEAAKIYDEVRAANVPLQRVIEATRGAILARKEDGIPLLLETLRSSEKKLFQLALSTIREVPGNKLDKELAAELSRTSPARAALLIYAMTDRNATGALPAILTAAQEGNRQVRISAIESLQRIGNGSCLGALLKIAGEDDQQLAAAATQTLARLPGKGVNQSIVEMLPPSQGRKQILLLNLVGQRRIGAVAEVKRALDQGSPAVRAAALKALGETVSLKELPVLISQVVASSQVDEGKVAQRALRAASVRMPDREACARELSSALRSARGTAQIVMLEILSEVGGATAMQTIVQACKSKDTQLQDAGSRLLGKWNSVAAATALLDLAKTGPVEKYRVRALRGYIGLARKFAMKPEQRARMCRNAFEITERPAERKLVLAVLQLHPSAEGLKLAVEASKVAELKQDATQAAVAIAGRIGGKDASKLLSGVGLERVQLEIVSAHYGAGQKQKDVTDMLRKLASDLQLITLKNANYNISFGGDPAPGTVKQLTIQYRINGKPAKVSFAENTAIILPMPE